MKKLEIQIRTKSIKGIGDFAELLNDIKKDEFKTSRYKISPAMLYHYSNHKIVEKRYRTFHIHKKNGKLREINAPCYQLGSILHLLNILFKALYTPSSSVMGFTEGRSVVSNASVHTGHHYVYNIDLENFFPSIRQARVWARIQLPPFNFPKEVADVVAGLCCNVNEEGTDCVLPQGAATSPILTNAVCERLDYLMRGVAKRFGLHYTRYADDMTFSSMKNEFKEDGGCVTEIKRIIKDQGFKLNDDKTRLQRTGERQEVTGLTVNECVNLAKKFSRDLRCILHVWEKDGYGKAYAYFYPFYKHDKGYIKKGEPVMENVIRGKLNYIKMVKGSSNDLYNKLLSRFNKLLTPVYVDKETDKSESYVYVYSYTINEFQKEFDTNIKLVTSQKGNLVGKCIICSYDKTIAISKSTQKLFKKDNDVVFVPSAETDELLSKCYVTLCRAKGKNFWLLTHKPMRRTIYLGLVNVNADVDKLLDIWQKEGIEEAAKEFEKAVKSGLITKTPEPIHKAPEVDICTPPQDDDIFEEELKRQVEYFSNIEDCIDGDIDICDEGVTLLDDI